MLTKDECQKIVDIALKYAKLKNVQLEVSIDQNLQEYTRFANNHITQNQSQDNLNISLRVISDKKQTKYIINQFDDATIHKAIDSACDILKLLPDESELITLPSKQEPCKLIDRYFEQTVNFSPEEKSQTVKKIVAIASESNLIANGLINNGYSLTSIGNSNNLFQYFVESQAGFSLTLVSSKEATGWTKELASNIDTINFITATKNVAQNTAKANDPCDIKPGHYTVVLPHLAVSDLLGYLWDSFSATSFLDKRSCFLDKLGKQVLGKNITIFDDPFDPRQLGPAFDGVGVNTKKVTLVENGILKNLLYNASNAERFHTQQTGHSLPQPSIEGEYPRNIVVCGGQSTLDELIKSTDYGIYLTRVWYVREVDPSLKIVTGMTRDGTFLIENGKITKPVKNLRFNESLLDMLNRVEILGDCQLAYGEEGMPVVVPSMKVAAFNFESSTKF